ncbi:MAG: hypothetical protein KAS17_11660 [Victivallaceae bacterium]|nr:hypothetical protein [Victivallaceae bacterium]
MSWRMVYAESELVQKGVSFLLVGTDFCEEPFLNYVPYVLLFTYVTYVTYGYMEVPWRIFCYFLDFFFSTLEKDDIAY